MKVEEQLDKEVSELDLLTQNLAALTAAVQTLNDVQLVMLHNMKDMKMPDWKSKSDVENDVSQKVIDCIKAVRKVYGQHETDKS